MPLFKYKGIVDGEPLEKFFETPNMRIAAYQFASAVCAAPKEEHVLSVMDSEDNLLPVLYASDVSGLVKALEANTIRVEKELDKIEKTKTGIRLHKKGTQNESSPDN